MKEQVDVTLHKEAVLKARLNPWLEESYAVTGNIEGKLATLQETQQKLQDDSTGVVTEQTVEDAKQAAAQCTTEVAVIRVNLDGPLTKIFTSTE